MEAAFQLLCRGVQQPGSEFGLDGLCQNDGGSTDPIYGHPVEFLALVEPAQHHAIGDQPVTFVQAYAVRRLFGLRQKGVSEHKVVAAQHHLVLFTKRSWSSPELACGTDMDDLEDFFKAEAEAQEAANGRVRPEQNLQPGDFCVREKFGIRIYSEILDAAQHLLGGRDEATLDEEDRADIEDTRNSYQEHCMRFYRFTRSFSRACPRGELGDIHLATVGRKITREEFEMAQKTGWP